MASNQSKLGKLIVILVFLVLFLILLYAGFAEWISVNPAILSFLGPLVGIPTFSLYWVLSNPSNASYPLGSSYLVFLAAAVFYFIALISALLLLRSRRLLLPSGILSIISAIIGFVAVGAISSNSYNGIPILLAGSGTYLVLSVGIIYIILYALARFGLSLDEIVKRLLLAFGIKK
jgi:hypothetical protein